MEGRYLKFIAFAIVLCFCSTPSVAGQTTNSTANSTTPLQNALAQFIGLATNATGSLGGSLNAIVGNLTNLIAQRNGTNNMTQADAIQGVVDSVLDLKTTLLALPPSASQPVAGAVRSLANAILSAGLSLGGTNGSSNVEVNTDSLIGNLTNLIGQLNGIDTVTADVLLGLVASVLDIQGVLLTLPSGLSDATRATLTGLINVVNSWLANVVQRMGALDGISQLTAGVVGAVTGVVGGITGVVDAVLSSVVGILGGFFGR